MGLALASFPGPNTQLVSSPDQIFRARPAVLFFDKAAGRAKNLVSGDETSTQLVSSPDRTLVRGRGTRLALGSQVGEGLLPECSIDAGAETTEIEARLATYSLPLQIINDRLPTGSTNFDHDDG